MCGNGERVCAIEIASRSCRSSSVITYQSRTRVVTSDSPAADASQSPTRGHATFSARTRARARCTASVDVERALHALRGVVLDAADVRVLAAPERDRHPRALARDEERPGLDSDQVEVVADGAGVAHHERDAAARHGLARQLEAELVLVDVDPHRSPRLRGRRDGTGREDEGERGGAQHDRSVAWSAARTLGP